MLDTLEQQTNHRGVGWEVLLIDNDPSGSAKPVFDSYVLRSRLPLRYVHERTSGLSHARNRAIREARGVIVAFLDDDVLVPRCWLFEMLDVFERTGADCVGGRVLIKWEGQPESAVQACERELVAFDKGAKDIRLIGRDVPIGANLAFRAAVLQGQVFVAELGRTRTNLMGCEEVDSVLRLVKEGRRIWYSGAAAVEHRTAGERLTGVYYRRREYWNGVSLSAVDCLQKPWVTVRLRHGRGSRR